MSNRDHETTGDRDAEVETLAGEDASRARAGRKGLLVPSDAVPHASAALEPLPDVQGMLAEPTPVPMSIDPSHFSTPGGEGDDPSMTSMALPPPPPFAAIPYPAPSSGGTSMRVVRRKIRKLGGDEPGEPTHVDSAPPQASDDAPTAPRLPRVSVAVDEPRPATKGSPLVVAVYRTPVPPVAKAVTVDLIKPTPIPSPPLPRVEAIVGEDFAVPAVEELTAQSVDPPPPPPVSAKRSLPPGIDPVGVREVPPRRPASIPPMSVKPVALPSPLPPPSTAVADDGARDSTPMISYGDPASLPPAADDDGVEVAVDDSAEVEVERLSSPDDLSAEARALEAARVASVPPPPPLPEAARGAVKTGAARSMAVTVVEARRKRRYWWEELFSEDYFRTLPRLEREQVRAEVDWIEHALGTESGAAILDLACGAGHHAAELALRRYDVTGLDLSPAMLGRATESAAAQGATVKWAQADMTQMEFEDAFDAAYCVGTSFGLFDDERNAEVARRLHRALKPHGTFLLQVLNRDHVIQRQPAMAWFEGEGCVCMEETSFNFITSRLNVKRTMIFDDGRQREIEYSVRLYSLNELGQVLHQAGFRILEVSGHPRTPGAFFGASSRELIILAQKRGAEVVEIPQDASPKLSPTEA